MAYGKKEEFVEARPNPWDERNKRRRDAIEAYIEQFKRASSIWHESAKEGWKNDLFMYISHVAGIQAQFMFPSPSGIGYDAAFLFGQSTPEQRWNFLKQQKNQAETGEINVSIPTNKIREWKEKTNNASPDVLENNIKF